MYKAPLTARDQALVDISHTGEMLESELEQKYGAAILTDLLEKGDVSRKKQGMFSKGPAKLVLTRQGNGKVSEF